MKVEVVNVLLETREWVYLYKWVSNRSTVWLANFMERRKTRTLWMQIDDCGNIIALEKNGFQLINLLRLV